MKLEKWALIAEIVGGVAILVTLIDYRNFERLAYVLYFAASDCWSWCSYWPPTFAVRRVGSNSAI